MEIDMTAAIVLRAAIVKWAELQSDVPRLSEATRRLVEIALKSEMPTKPRRSLRNKERAQRRRRLTKGPPEFREDRVDLPKAKR